jgi:Flp pilus assembly protein TadG
MTAYRIREVLWRLGRDERGVFAAMFAVMFPVILGIGALGIETGIWYTIKRHDQSIADVAAVAGATEIMRSGTCTSGTGADVFTSCPPAATLARTNNFDLNDAANSTSSLTFPYTGSTACSTSPNTCVRVVLQHQQTALLASLVLPSLTIANQAIAQVQTLDNTCAFTFGNNENGKGLDLRGTTGFTQPNCQLASNSTSPESIQLSGASELSLYSIYTAGGIDTDGNPDLTLTVAPRTYQPPLVDPYASVAVATTPADLTTFTMPTLASSATTFPTNLPRPPSAPGTTNFPSIASSSVSPPSSGCNTTSTSASISATPTCYLSLSGVQITGGTFASGTSYYFAGPVTISGAVTISGGVTIYVATGDFTVAAGGNVTFADNSNAANGPNAAAKIFAFAGNFDASAGSVTFTGDTSNNAGYAIRVGATKTTTFGTATFGGGNYAFQGGGLVLGGGNSTTTLGAARYKVETGGASVASGGTAVFSPEGAFSAASKTTELTVNNAGNFTGTGTVTFNPNNISGTSYSFSVASGTTFSGATNFGAASGDQKGYGFYDSAVTISPSGGSTATLGIVNFYVETGGLAINGPTTFAATTSGDCTTVGNCTTITIEAGNLTNNASGNLTFNGSASSQYNFCFGTISNQNACAGNSNGGATLAGPANFGAGLYYFMSNGNGPTGVTLDSGASATFAPATYSVQKGNFTISSGATGTFSAATGGNAACAPTGNATCLYLANGAFSNAGTSTFNSGSYYVYALASSGPSTCTNNSSPTICNAASGTMTLGSSASSIVYVNNPNGVFRNYGTLNFGSGTYYIYDAPPPGTNGNTTGGFANFGTMTLCGFNTGGGCSETASNYYFFNGPSQGTDGPDSGKCANSATVFGALSLMGGSSTTLGPGNYYLVNGDLCMNQDNGTVPLVNCSGCTLGDQGMTFILTGTGTGTTLSDNISTVQILNPIDTTGGPLYSPGSGPYQGLLFFQDRNAPLDDYNGLQGSCGVNCNTILGGALMDLTGAIYMSQAELGFGGNSGASSGECLVILVDSLRFTGNATLNTEGCAAAGVSTVTSQSVALLQ